MGTAGVTRSAEITGSKTMVVEADKALSAASYASAAALATGGGFALNEWLMVGGFALAVATFLVNVHYRRKSDKRHQQLHDHEMRARSRHRG